MAKTGVCPLCGSENWEWVGDAFAPDNGFPYHCHECDRFFGVKVGDHVKWNDRELMELGDDRVWEVYEVHEDLICIRSGEIGKPGYSEAEVPLFETSLIVEDRLMMTKFEKAIKPATYDFYKIVEDELGNKQLELCGYTYKGDNWKCIDVRGVVVPLSEFVEGMAKSEDYVNSLYQESKQYEQDMSNEECVWAINHCFDNKPADYVLRFEDVTIDTSCGNYANKCYDIE